MSQKQAPRDDHLVGGGVDAGPEPDQERLALAGLEPGLSKCAPRIPRRCSGAMRPPPLSVTVRHVDDDRYIPMG